MMTSFPGVFRSVVVQLTVGMPRGAETWHRCTPGRGGHGSLGAGHYAVCKDPLAAFWLAVHGSASWHSRKHGHLTSTLRVLRLCLMEML